MKKLLALCLMLVLTGCAWQHGRTMTFDSVGNMIKDSHCFAIVIGDGELGTICDIDGKMMFWSKETGFSEMAPGTLGAVGTLIGNAVAAGTGTGAAANAGSTVLGLGAETLKDGGGDDFPDIPMPTKEDTQ